MIGKREERRREWVELRPEFERIVFRAGYRWVERESGISAGNVRKLLAGEGVPNRTTLICARRAIRCWFEEHAEAV